MHEIPHAVLSERFQEVLQRRRVKSAVFLSFGFEPDFFEQEILPAVLTDLPLSHVPAVRLLQLEDALRSAVDHIAVYYDRGALLPGSQSAKLDIRRVPITYRTGYFHPKNVLLLTEAAESDSDQGSEGQSLLVATLSANLTRRGWWENVEVCHIEEAREGTLCSFRDDLLDLFRRVRAAAPAEEEHAALEAIGAFVRSLTPRAQMTSDGLLHPRLYSGGESVCDFLHRFGGRQLQDLCLEVISPYFDAHDAKPLRELCDRFTPREVRVYLPRDDDGTALCGDTLYQSVRSIGGVQWGQLPADLVRAGRKEQVKRRTVHAKVYRFFHPRQRYEALFVGSVNLTMAAHSRGGNLESAFLLEFEPKRVSDWWLQIDNRKPVSYGSPHNEDASEITIPLSVRYDWSSGTSAAFWDARDPSGRLHITAQGVSQFELDQLPPRQWRELSDEASDSLRRLLPNSSFLSVSEDNRPPATILVQEDGMAHKPSILYTLSVADILRYWSLLTPEQRAAFHDERIDLNAEALAQLGRDRAKLAASNSFFDSFAAIYHGFHMLERAICQALDEGRDKEATYRLLGKKYDSLSGLLARLDSEPDLVKRYLMALCAKQLLQEIERLYPRFLRAHQEQVRELVGQISAAARVREDLDFGTPADRETFLGWFDEWFLHGVQPSELRG